MAELPHAGARAREARPLPETREVVLGVRFP